MRKLTADRAEHTMRRLTAAADAIDALLALDEDVMEPLELSRIATAQVTIDAMRKELDR